MILRSSVWTASLALLAFLSATIHVNGVNLTIFYTSDIRGQIWESDEEGSPCNPTPCVGGLARVATVVKRARNVSANVLLLDAGDMRYGSPAFFNRSTEFANSLFEAVGYDVMALGDHDFDEGEMNLKDTLAGATYKVVGSNIKAPATFTDGLNGTFMPYTIKKISGLKIGIIGYTTNLTAVNSMPGEIRFGDIVESVKRTVMKIITQENPKVIIALGHAARETAMELAKMATDLANKVPITAAVVNGDCYGCPVPTGSTDDADKTKAVVVGMPRNTVPRLGKLLIELNRTGHVISRARSIVPLDSKTPQDKDVLKQLQAVETEVVKESKNNMIGMAEMPLQGSGACYDQDCSLGNLITDSIVYYHEKMFPSETYPRVALISNGPVKGTIPKGSISLWDIMNILPNNTGYVKTLVLTGKQLKTILQEVLDGQAASCRTVLQVSGMKFTYDFNRPVGQRLTELKVMKPTKIETAGIATTKGTQQTSESPGAQSGGTGAGNADTSSAEEANSTTPATSAVAKRADASSSTNQLPGTNTSSESEDTTPVPTPGGNKITVGNKTTPTLSGDKTTVTRTPPGNKTTQGTTKDDGMMMVLGDSQSVRMFVPDVGSLIDNVHRHLMKNAAKASIDTWVKGAVAEYIQMKGKIRYMPSEGRITLKCAAANGTSPPASNTPSVNQRPRPGVTVAPKPVQRPVSRPSKSKGTKTGASSIATEPSVSSPLWILTQAVALTACVMYK